MLLKQCLKAAKRVLILIHVLICYNTVTHSWLWKKKIVCKQQIWTAPSPVCTPYVCKILMDFNTVLCSCCNQRASFSVTLIKLRAGSQINIMHPLRHTQGGELEAAALRSSQEPQQPGSRQRGGQNVAGEQCSSHLLEPVKEKTAE